MEGFACVMPDSQHRARGKWSNATGPQGRTWGCCCFSDSVKSFCNSFLSPLAQGKTSAQDATNPNLPSHISFGSPSSLHSQKWELRLLQDRDWFSCVQGESLPYACLTFSPHKPWCQCFFKQEQSALRAGSWCLCSRDASTSSNTALYLLPAFKQLPQLCAPHRCLLLGQTPCVGPNLPLVWGVARPQALSWPCYLQLPPS